MQISDALKENCRKVFLEEEYEYPALFLAEDDDLKYSVKFPLYVDDQDSYAVALNKAMMLSSYNNGLNSVVLFVATEDGQYFFTAFRNRIDLFQITDNEEFVRVDGNVVDSFTNMVMREYLSTYSKKDYTEEVIETLDEQGFEVNAF